jgi:DNA modification methylase
VACVHLGRRYIGIESDPEHYATSVARITEELERNILFEPPPAIVQRSLLEAE